MIEIHDFDIGDAKKHRVDFRKSSNSGKGGYWTRTEYKRLMKDTALLLEKYMVQMDCYLNVYYNTSGKTIKEKIKKCVSQETFDKATLTIRPRGSAPLITINEVVALAKELNLNEDFVEYCVNKTHLSFTIGTNEIKTSYAVTPWKKRVSAMKKGPRRNLFVNRDKFAEFVYLILSLYITLHNLMWSSSLRPKSVKSIDKFLRPIK